MIILGAVPGWGTDIQRSFQTQGMDMPITYMIIHGCQRFNFLPMAQRYRCSLTQSPSMLNMGVSNNGLRLKIHWFFIIPDKNCHSSWFRASQPLAHFGPSCSFGVSELDFPRGGQVPFHCCSHQKTPSLSMFLQPSQNPTVQYSLVNLYPHSYGKSVLFFFMGNSNGFIFQVMSVMSH